MKEYLQQQTRFKMLKKSNPEHAKVLWQEAQQDADTRFHLYEYLAQRKNGAAAARRRSATGCGDREIDINTIEQRNTL